MSGAPSGSQLRTDLQMQIKKAPTSNFPAKDAERADLHQRSRGLSILGRQAPPQFWGKTLGRRSVTQRRSSSIFSTKTTRPYSRSSDWWHKDNSYLSVGERPAKLGLLRTGENWSIAEDTDAETICVRRQLSITFTKNPLRDRSRTRNGKRQGGWFIPQARIHSFGVKVTF